MNRQLLTIKGYFICIGLLLSFGLLAQQASKTAAILQQAVLKRTPWKQMSCQATLRDQASGNSSSAYRIFYSDDRVLIACTQPASQRGNLLLLQERDLWLYLKSTSKPVRITPLERLSGAVSFVDMARLNWVTDFVTDSVHTVSLAGSQPAFLYYLHAARPDVPYRQIRLWIGQKTGRPVQADIYLSSEKVYKTLLFTKYASLAGRDVNTELECIDHFNHDKTSLIDFSGIRPEKKIPEPYFHYEQLPKFPGR
jgi:outer membrane lipoprotein-sorting protein